MLALQCPVNRGDRSPLSPTLSFSALPGICVMLCPVPVPLQVPVFPFGTFSDLAGPNLGAITANSSSLSQQAGGNWEMSKTSHFPWENVCLPKFSLGHTRGADRFSHELVLQAALIYRGIKDSGTHSYNSKLSPN